MPKSNQKTGLEKLKAAMPGWKIVGAGPAANVIADNSIPVGAGISVAPSVQTMQKKYFGSVTTDKGQKSTAQTVIMTPEHTVLSDNGIPLHKVVIIDDKDIIAVQG